ncbi:MAG: sigma-70 family RNA polymerase sigma factor [Gemmatimonadetes bacterium]|nr:sigma-70 family RNA polymerase sigma factor [Gemmatimonadota bacterium]
MTASVADSPPHSFDTVALPHLPAVARVARALTRDAVDADDLVQETFLRALRHWNTFVPGSDCRRWLATICRNAFLAQVGRGQMVTAVEDDALEAYAAADAHLTARGAGLNDLFDRFELGPAIRAAIAALDPVFRDVVTLSDVEGFSYEEIAELLMIPLGTVRSRLYRARRQLQETLIAHAIDRGFASAPRTTP